MREGSPQGDVPQNWTLIKEWFRTVNPISWVQIILKIGFVSNQRGDQIHKITLNINFALPKQFFH
jgi:hypothetical protein